MGAPTFTALVGDLRTGKITTRLPLTGCAWQQVLGSAGTITGATVNVADASVRALDVYHSAAPGKAFLAIQYDQSILAAGPIWTHHYTRSTGTVTMGATGLWGLFDHRLVLPVLSQPLAVGAAQAATTSYATGANLSLGDIAAALVTQAQAHVGGNLPLVMPAAQGMTPGAIRNYLGYDLHVLGAKLTELSGVVGGPEIAFRPRIKATDPTSIEWVMLVGSPAQPWLAQAGPDWVFDASVPKSMVSDIDIDVDATVMATRAWLLGSGSQTGLMLSQADSTVLTAAGYPLLEVVDGAHTSDGVQSDLDGYAAQTLAARNRPATIWKVKVRNDGADGAGGPQLGQYQAGDFCQIITGDDPYLSMSLSKMIGDAWSDIWSDIWPGTVVSFSQGQSHRGRILQVDGDLGYESTLTMATTQAEV